MKDLVFLMIVLGLITFGMMAAQKYYRGEEAEKNRKWERARYYKEPTSSPTPSPTATVAP